VFLKSETITNPTDNKPILPIRTNIIAPHSNLKNTPRDRIDDVENGQAEADTVENRQDHELKELLTFGNG